MTDEEKICLLIYPCIFTLWKWNSEVKKQKFTSTKI